MSPRRPSSVLQWIGKSTPDKIENVDWRDASIKGAEREAKKYPGVVKVEMKGTRPHKSSKDLSDPHPVISADLCYANGNKAISIHIHQDGSTKPGPRSQKEKKKA